VGNRAGLVEIGPLGGPQSIGDERLRLADRVDRILAAAKARSRCGCERAPGPADVRRVDPRRLEMADRAVGPDEHIDRGGATVGSTGDDHIRGTEAGKLVSDRVDIDDTGQGAPSEQGCLTEVRGDHHRRRKEPLAIGPLDLLGDKAVASTVDENRVDDRPRQHAGVDAIGDDIDDRR